MLATGSTVARTMNDQTPHSVVQKDYKILDRLWKFVYYVIDTVILHHNRSESIFFTTQRLMKIRKLFKIYWEIKNTIPTTVHNVCDRVHVRYDSVLKKMI